jgi:hypothetical protein
MSTSARAALIKAQTRCVADYSLNPMTVFG